MLELFDTVFDPLGHFILAHRFRVGLFLKLLLDDPDQPLGLNGFDEVGIGTTVQ